MEWGSQKSLVCPSKLRENKLLGGYPGIFDFLPGCPGGAQNLSALKSQRCLRFPIAMPALRFKGAMESR